MNGNIRVILLVVGFIIIIGIIWDIIRARLQSNVDTKHTNSKPNGLFKDVFLFFKGFSKNFSKSLSFFKGIHLNTFALNSKERSTLKYTGEDHPAASSPIDSLQLDFFDQPFSTFTSTSASTFTSKSTSTSSTPKHKATRAERAPGGELIILNVVAKQSGVFSGKKLYEAFHHLNLYHGEMQIFHRYENMDGTGEIVFSIASAVEPGIFEISKMENFATPGLSLFYVTSRPNQSIAAFELMLRTAKQLASRLDGELRDQDRKFLTAHGIENYRSLARSK